MSILIRPFAGEFDQVAPLLGVFYSDGLTPQEMREWHERFPADGKRSRLVADADGRIVGYANVSHGLWDRRGKFSLTLVVEPEYRRRGIGQVLLAAAERFAREQGGAELATTARDSDEESVVFARKRGFAIDRQMFESVLDVPAFDESRFAGVVEQVRAGGIRFFTMAEAPDETSRRRLYDDVARHSEPDSPGYDLEEFVPYEHWYKHVFESESVSLDRIFVAAEGETYAGVAVLERRANGALYNGYTGVHREFRGRKIALALKLLTVRKAREMGAPHIRTHNDSLNGPMLAINRKMGYVQQPGNFSLKKQL
jgi:GNAT superfamily N-acetyltransferase